MALRIIELIQQHVEYSFPFLSGKNEKMSIMLEEKRN